MYILEKGMAWHGMACHGMPWHAMACHGMPWHVMAWHAMACIGMPWHAMAGQCMPWHAMTCHGMPMHATACRGMPWHANVGVPVGGTRTPFYQCGFDKNSTLIKSCTGDPVGGAESNNILGIYTGLDILMYGYPQRPKILIQ